MSPGTAFRHRAKAYGIDGKFHWPVQEVIQARPTVSLPSNGGFLKDSEHNYNSNDLVSFRRAYTEVSGGQSDETVNGRKVKAENNLSLTVIEGFDLLNVISVEKIVSRITTRYFLNSKEKQPEVVLVGTRFEGFRVAGYEVKVKLAVDLFLEHSTHEKSMAVKARLPKNKAPRVDDKTPAYTLVKKIEVPEPTDQFTVKGNVIEIPHIGQLYLAELDVAPEFKSLNMIRWELGCPNGGSGGIGGTEGGGSPPGQ